MTRVTKESEAATTSGVHPRDIVDKYLRWVLGFAIALTLVFGIKHVAEGRKDVVETQQHVAQTTSMPATTSCDLHSQIPLVCWPQSSWPKLVMSAGGKSEMISIPLQMYVKWGGGNFRVTCVYGDKHEISYGAGEAPCPGGDMPFVYTTNTDVHEANVISYAYAHD